MAAVCPKCGAEMAEMRKYRGHDASVWGCLECGYGFDDIAELVIDVLQTKLKEAERWTTSCTWPAGTGSRSRGLGRIWAS